MKHFEHVSAYPLCWPEGWPRTEASKRAFGRFSKKSNSGWNKDITLSQAVNRVLNELGMFTRVGRPYRVNPNHAIISSMLVLRNDGLPRSGQRTPSDPGVAVYFELDGNPQVVPCDQYSKIEQNIAAVAATLSALRTLERHGSGIMERAFTGFAALPDPNQEKPWWEFFGYKECPEDVPLTVFKQIYHRLARQYHPDTNGGVEDPRMRELNAAWEKAKEELK